MATRTLTELENRILDFAETRPVPLRDGDRARIREVFGWHPATYVQRLNRLMDDPVALTARPQLIGRLRRLRATSVTLRASRSFALQPQSSLEAFG